MHLGLGEVRQAPRVVEVEVGERDVADVGGIEPHRPDPLDRGLLRLRLGPQGEVERDPEAPVGVAGVLDAEPGLDQHQVAAGLDQQAMANDLG